MRGPTSVPAQPGRESRDIVTLATATATPTTIFRTTESTVRIAAIGDVHLRNEIPENLAADLAATVGVADVLVLAGDITENGRLPEVELAAGLLAALPIPIVAVLGNHDRRCLRRAALRDALRLQSALAVLDADSPEITVVVMHYAPTTTTLGNEPLAKHWMLGNSLLGSVVDGHEVDLVIHGHAHLGNQEGQTPGGVPVRNVAEQVVGRSMLYEVGPGRAVRNLDRVSHWTTTRSLPA